MPFFKSTLNILKRQDYDEVFDPNWMDSDTLILPERKKWDYARELAVEDVDIWEVIIENGPLGVYAAWSPYAEFYMITTGVDYSKFNIINNINFQDRLYETYYGPNSGELVKKRAAELGIFLQSNYIWVDEEDMFLYS